MTDRRRAQITSSGGVVCRFLLTGMWQAACWRDYDNFGRQAAVIACEVCFTDVVTNRGLCFDLVVGHFQGLCPKIFATTWEPATLVAGSIFVPVPFTVGSCTISSRIQYIRSNRESCAGGRECRVTLGLSMELFRNSYRSFSRGKTGWQGFQKWRCIFENPEKPILTKDQGPRRVSKELQ